MEIVLASWMRHVEKIRNCWSVEYLCGGGEAPNTENKGHVRIMDENGTMILWFPFLAVLLTTTNSLMILNERTNDGSNEIKTV